MSSVVYRYPYSILEEHVNIPLAHEVGATASIKNFYFFTGEREIVLKMEQCDFRRTDGLTQEVNMELSLYELVVEPTDGVDTGDLIISANLDRDANRDLIGLEIKFDGIIDLTGAKRLMRFGGIGARDSRQSIPVSGVVYSLRRNTYYLLRSEVISGTTGVSESTFIGDLILIAE